MEKLSFTEEIQTNRLILRKRKATKKYAEKLSTLIKENQNFLKQWMSFAVNPLSTEEQYKSLLKNDELWEKMENAGYLIFDKSDNLIGASNVSFIDYDVESAEIGYWLGKQFTKKGYATETVLALEDEFFNRGLERMEIRCDQLNIDSIKVALRCGYTQEGILRQNDWNASHDKRIDTVIFFKLKSKWMQNR